MFLDASACVYMCLCEGGCGCVGVSVVAWVGVYCGVEMHKHSQTGCPSLELAKWIIY